MNWGGQEFRTVLESIYLNEHHHNSWLLCDENSEIYKKGKLLGLNVIAMNLTKAWRIDIAIKILFFCLKNRIDIINTHSAKDSTLCLLSYFFGIPIIRSRQISNQINKLLSYKYACTHIMAAAQVIKNNLITSGINKDKITVIGEGVDTNQFNPNVDCSYLKTEFSISDNDRIIVNIGMIREDKGQIYLLEAARIIIKQRKDIKFFIIGEGIGNKIELQKLHNFIKQHKLENNIFMTGYREDIAQFTQLADLVVVASIGTEAQSRVVPQAFATQKTVVSTNTGGLTELVKHEHNGLVVAPKDAQAMANAISRLLSDNTLQQKLAANAFEFAQSNLSFDNMMTKTIALYKSIKRTNHSRSGVRTPA
jgi:glycosyltransferase involved in cell wall biosynthesis